MRPSPFWDFAQGRLAVSYRHFGPIVAKCRQLIANKRREASKKGEDNLKMRHEKEDEEMRVGLFRLRMGLKLWHVANRAVNLWVS